MLRLAVSAALAVASAGCATGREPLYPAGGDTFSIRRFVDRPREPVLCGGTRAERFSCVASALHERAQGKHWSGALAAIDEAGPTETVVEGASLEVQRFGIGSVSKMVLAAALLSVAENEHLDLHAPLERIVPELAGTPEVDVGDVSLHQLLTHTAGIPSLVDCRLPDDLQRLLLSLRGKRLWAPPGAVYNYSNLGYALVAAVMERATHSPFEQIVRERVLAPVGIAAASYEDAPSSGPTAARRAGGELWCRAQNPSGGLRMNIAEIAAWVRALTLAEHSPLGTQSIARMTTAYVRSDDYSGEMYGYGVGLTKHDGQRVFFHGGSLSDSASFVAWLPERHFGAAALVNAPVIPITPVHDALSAMLDLSPLWLPTPSRPHADWHRYEGTYLDGAGALGMVRVEIEGDHLALRYIGGDPTLKPTSFAFASDSVAPDRARYIVTAVGIGTRLTSSR